MGSTLSILEQFNESKLSVFSEDEDESQILPPESEFPHKSPLNGLVRRHSFNSFPFESQDLKTVSSSEGAGVRKQGIPSIQFKIQYFKFIDLLIDREIAASMKS